VRKKLGRTNETGRGGGVTMVLERGHHTKKHKKKRSTAPNREKTWRS